MTMVYGYSTGNMTTRSKNRINPEIYLFVLMIILAVKQYIDPTYCPPVSIIWNNNRRMGMNFMTLDWFQISLYKLLLVNTKK